MVDMEVVGYLSIIIRISWTKRSSTTMKEMSHCQRSSKLEYLESDLLFMLEAPCWLKEKGGCKSLPYFGRLLLLRGIRTDQGFLDGFSIARLIGGIPCGSDVTLFVVPFCPEVG